MSARATLIGDIGGTNTRLALADAAGCGDTARYDNAAVGTLEACLDDYLRRGGLLAADLDLLLAVAAPVSGDCVRLTNLDWLLDGAVLGARFGFRAVRFVNDFVALAWAVPALAAADSVAIGGGAARPDAPVLVLGPGTGFGASLWLPHGGALASEAGHALISAVSDEELALLERVCAQLGAPPSIEQLVSGPGLERLYRVLGGPPADAATVYAAALAGDDDIALAALGHFHAFAGIAARNLALATGARGGVYLAGGILPRAPAALRRSRFRERFETPAPLPGYLEAIPTRLVVHPEPALLGLARLATSDTAA
ncbi:MAG: glucokinase [Gammaproteobacteria bacterium]